MASISHNRRTANETNIEELMADTAVWNSLLLTNTEEVKFLKALLTADVFEESIPNLYERLQEFYNEIEESKMVNIDLHESLRNHKNDLNGMMECEDISCESFYHSQHQALSNRIHDQLSKFQEIKLHIFRFCSPVLRKNK